MASTSASTSAAASSGCSSPSSVIGTGCSRAAATGCRSAARCRSSMPHCAGVPVQRLEAGSLPAPRRPAGRRPRSAPAAAGRCRRSARPRTSASRRCASRRTSRAGGRASDAQQVLQRRADIARRPARARPSTVNATCRGLVDGSASAGTMLVAAAAGSGPASVGPGWRAMTSPSAQAARPRWSPSCGVVEPAAVVGHEVVHAVAAAESQAWLQEGERCGQHPGVARVAELALQAERDDRPAARRRRRSSRWSGCGTIAVGVLDDADVVDQGEQVVEAGARGSVAGGAACSTPAGGPSATASASTSERLAARPAARRARRRRRRASVAGSRSSSSGSSSRSSTAAACAAASSNGTSTPAPGAEQVLRVVVRRRDHRAAGDDGEGQRAGDDLLARPVRRQVEVGGGQQHRQLGLGEEAVEEVHVLGQVELARPAAPEPDR